MSTAQRGRGGERGGRSRGTTFHRGANRGRGGFGGTRTNGDGDGATTPTGPRAQTGGSRGSAHRGGFNTRGESSRGRAGTMYAIPPVGERVNRGAGQGRG